MPDGRETGGFGRGRDGRRGCSATRRMDSVSVAEFITVRFQHIDAALAAIASRFQ